MELEEACVGRRNVWIEGKSVRLSFLYVGGGPDVQASLNTVLVVLTHK